MESGVVERQERLQPGPGVLLPEEFWLRRRRYSEAGLLHGEGGQQHACEPAVALRLQVRVLQLRGLKIEREGAEQGAARRFEVQRGGEDQVSRRDRGVRQPRALRPKRGHGVRQAVLQEAVLTLRFYV